MPATPSALGATLHHLASAAEPKICARRFAAAIAAFGVDTYACGQVDLEARERSVFYAIGWPESWRKFYLASGLLERDPIVEALSHRHAAFTWAELRRDKRMSVIGTNALRLIAEHGWTEGLAVPVASAHPRRRGLVGLAARRGPFRAWEKSELTGLCLCFYGTMRALAPLHGFPVPPAGLTAREIECMTLVAQGASDREVAQAMKVARTTAHEFVEKAKKKLKATTRAQAAAMAVSLGIVPA